ncbi:MAG: substrate-binding domain-containing protein, partial [Clostridia bacterium]|nr:substrate-binding domain-containing protein [Clostridia bacterium]
PLEPEAELRRNVLVAGCDPALGLLAGWLAGRGAPCRLVWVHAPSRGALAALLAGEVHLAGVHLYDEPSGSYNVAAVRRALPRAEVLLVHLAQWEQGLVVAPGNPLAIRRAEDLADPRVRLVNREPGSGARELLDRLLRQAGIPPRAVRGYDREVPGHLAVGWAVASGGADAGIGSRATAEAFGLDFIPLSRERFDLVVPADLADDPRMDRLLDTVASGEFRAQLASVAGYDTGETGRAVPVRTGDPPSE